MLMDELLKYKKSILIHVVFPLLIGLVYYFFSSSLAFTHLLKSHFADGEIIYSAKLSGTVTRINTQNWASGSYYYRVLGNDGANVQGKLFIMH